MSWPILIAFFVGIAWVLVVLAVAGAIHKTDVDSDDAQPRSAISA